jgi:hypothetical protein
MTNTCILICGMAVMDAVILGYAVRRIYAAHNWED